MIFEYRSKNGQVVKGATRMRFSLAEKSKAKLDGEPMVYGLWRIP